jgi:hypothetical protein
MTTKVKAKPKPLEMDGCHWIATEGSILVPEIRAVCITIGLELKSQGQWSKNWRATYGRSQQLRKRVQQALRMVAVQDVTHHLGGVFPRCVSFTRLAPRLLDSDNCASVFKPARDQVVAWLAGRNETNARADDGMRSGYEFSYHQQQQRAHGVQIELSCEA